MVYRGCGDYNWLSHWQSVDFPRYPLREMEALQKLYATDACGNKSFRDSVDMSSPLVVVRVSAVLERARHARALPPFLQHMTLISSRRSAQEPARLALVTSCYRTVALTVHKRRSW